MSVTLSASSRTMSATARRKRRKRWGTPRATSRARSAMHFATARRKPRTPPRANQRKRARQSRSLFRLRGVEAFVVARALDRATPLHDLRVHAHEVVGHYHGLRVVDGIVVRDDHFESITVWNEALLGAHLRRLRKSRKAERVEVAGFHIDRVDDELLAF